MFKHDLGVHAKDIVTGFTGVIVGRVQYLTGCNQYLVQAKKKDKSEFGERTWLDEHRLEINAKKKILVLPEPDDKKYGADAEAPKK